MSLFKKIWCILTSQQRKAAVTLLGLMLISMVVETFGIGLVIPAMILITQNDIADKYPFLEPWLVMLGNPTHESILIIGLLILVSVYLFKTSFLVFLAWMQGKFLFGIQVNLSHRLYEGYLRQHYVFHLKRNSAQLIRNVGTETELFAYKAILASMTFMTELLVIIGITALLLTLEPLGAILVAIILGVAGTAFHVATKKKLLAWGQARQLHEALRLQQLHQGLGGSKEVKLLGREEEFLTQFSLHNIKKSSVSRWENLLQTLPRLFLELLVVTSLVVLMFAMLAQGKSVAAFMPALALFAAAAFRLMPAANRLLGALQNLRYSLPVTNTLYSEINELQELAKHSVQNIPIVFSRCLELKNISYSYPDATVDAIEHVNLIIPQGTSIGFIGESGAGKSTLIDLILGLLTPVEGQITVDGTNIQSNIRGWQDQIGYVPQSIYLSDDTICKNIAFGVAVNDIDETSISNAVKAAQLDEFIATLPNGLETFVGERGIRLSGGQRQRIGIARALYHNPSVLVLDEATSSLDIGTEREVMQAVYALKGERTLIIIAHRMSTVEHCDRLVHVEHGKIIEEKVSHSAGLEFHQFFSKMDNHTREENV
ncbi:MAG: ABC transporter ATP-binding protein [Legionella sp.]|nr:MAG: ABC transporter ATP-binding protein [Legionella sp.]